MKRTPLKRKTPLKAKKRINQMSSKRKALASKRRDFVADFLAKHPNCKACLLRGFKFQRPSTEVHEPLTRARAPGPDTILNPDNAVAICWDCHRWVHDNPKEATALGLLKHSWDER